MAQQIPRYLIKRNREKDAPEEETSSRVMKELFGDVPLTDTERRFLASAEAGDLVDVIACVAENETLKINCKDYLGRSGLQLAVLGEHVEVIQYLLDRCKLEVIEDALMHAISNNNAKICEIILNHKVYSNRRYRLKLEFQHEFYDQDESNPFFSSDLTPLVLAAHINHFDIIHLLIQKGFTIQPPHDFFCSCTECRNHQEFDQVVHSKSRLNAFRGLASTAYISLSSEDPIYDAFKLSRQLENLSNTEKQYKSEYQILCDQCSNYAVELFDLCRTQEEVLSALHGEADITDLCRIKLAVKYVQKKFIAHSACQEHLMNIWYGEIGWLRHASAFRKAILFPLGIILMPVIAIIYFLAPKSKLGRLIRVPIVKFTNHTVSYVTFLVLLFIATNRDRPSKIQLFDGSFGIVNALILLFVLGMFWAEVKQLWEEGFWDYFYDLWNLMDVTMIALYTASYAIQIVTSYYLSVEMDWSVPPLQLANVLFSVANVLSFSRIVYYLPASETFGQLQISYGRMLQDVGKFVVIYFTVMLSFVCGLTGLYVKNSQNEYFGSLWKSISSLYWSTFGMGYSDSPQLDNPDYALTMYAGYVLYGIYLLGAVVVLINMLIAMMSNTFQQIQDEEDVEWKFARAKLWLYYIQEGATLPIPFNLLPTPKAMWRFCYIMKEGCLHYICTRRDKAKKPCIVFRNHKAVMYKVILRYIHKTKYGKKGEGLKADINDSKEELQNQVTKFQDQVDVKFNYLEEELWKIKAISKSVGQKVLALGEILGEENIRGTILSHHKSNGDTSQGKVPASKGNISESSHTSQQHSNCFDQSGRYSSLSGLSTNSGNNKQGQTMSNITDQGRLQQIDPKDGKKTAQAQQTKDPLQPKLIQRHLRRDDDSDCDDHGFPRF